MAILKAGTVANQTEQKITEQEPTNQIETENDEDQSNNQKTSTPTPNIQQEVVVVNVGKQEQVEQKMEEQNSNNPAQLPKKVDNENKLMDIEDELFQQGFAYVHICSVVFTIIVATIFDIIYRS